MKSSVLIAALVTLPLLGAVTSCKKKPKAGAADAGTTDSAAVSPSAAGAARPGEGVIVWPKADLRSTPTQNGEVTAKLVNNVRVLVLERRDGWTRVRTVEGQREGWLLSQAVQGGVVVGGSALAKDAARPAPARARIRVDKTGVRLRESPNGQRFTVLARGASMEILREEGQWLEVEGGGKKGWVARKVVVVLPPSTAGSAATAAASPAAPAAPVGIGEGKVLFKTLNLREKPDGQVLSSLTGGTRVVLLAQTKAGTIDWLQVRGDDGRAGWVVARAIQRLAARVAAPAQPAASPAQPAAAPPQAAAAPAQPVAPAAPAAGEAVVAWRRVNLRESPPKGRVLATLVQGNRATVLGRREKFVHVRVADKEGWVVASALTMGERAAAPAAPAAAVEPARTAPVAPKPRHPDNEGDDDAAPAATGGGRAFVVSWTNVNVRKGPSKRDVAIDKFSRGTRVREVSAEGNWIEVQTTDGSRKGWVSKNALRPAR